MSWWQLSTHQVTPLLLPWPATTSHSSSSTTHLAELWWQTSRPRTELWSSWTTRMLKWGKTHCCVCRGYSLVQSMPASCRLEVDRTEFLYLDPENPHWPFFRMAEPWLRKTLKILVQYILLLFDFQNRCIINNQSHTLFDVIKCPWACWFFRSSEQISMKWKDMTYVNVKFYSKLLCLF